MQKARVVDEFLVDSVASASGNTRKLDSRAVKRCVRTRHHTRRDWGLESSPFGNISDTLLSVDDNGIVERFEIEALVGTVDGEVRLTTFHLRRKSRQDDLHMET